jgi:hypothetical protein
MMDVCNTSSDYMYGSTHNSSAPSPIAPIAPPIPPPRVVKLQRRTQDGRNFAKESGVGGSGGEKVVML